MLSQENKVHMVGKITKLNKKNWNAVLFVSPLASRGFLGTNNILMKKNVWIQPD